MRLWPRLSSARAASCRSPAASATACASSSVSVSPSRLSRALPMLTSACARVRSSPSSRRELERPLAPLERRLGVLGQHLELRHAAVGARELGRRAERLEDRDRLARQPPRGLAVALDPVVAREHARAAADGLDVAERAVDRDRALDRRERVVEPADRVGGGGQLLEHVRLLGRVQPVGELRGAAVERVRLAVRLQLGRPARGDERVLADDVVGAGRLGVVDDLGRVGVRGEQRAHDLVRAAAAAPRPGRSTGPRAAPARGGSAPTSAPTSSSCRRSGSTAASSQPGITAFSTDVGIAARHDRDELDEAARRVVEPRRAPEHGVRDRRRQRRSTAAEPSSSVT